MVEKLNWTTAFCNLHQSVLNTEKTVGFHVNLSEKEREKLNLLKIKGKKVEMGTKAFKYLGHYFNIDGSIKDFVRITERKKLIPITVNG